MRILVILSSLDNGGAQRVAAQITGYWAGRGHDVVLATLSRSRDGDYPLGPGVQHLPLGVAALSPNRASALFNNIGRVLRLRREILRLDPDVVIGLMTSANVLAALAGVGLRSRTIGCEHNTPDREPLEPIWRFGRLLTYRLLDAVTVLTQGAAAWIRTHVPCRRLLVVPNALTWPLPSLAPRLDPDDIVSKDRKVILAVGRLAPQKDFRTLLRAFGAIAADHPEWDLVILGDGELRPQLMDLRANLALEQRVLLPGHAGNMPDWYRRASILAMSSEYEGFPMVLVEALAFGLPVVSVDCREGPRDIVRDGIDGLLVADDDHEGLAAALSRLMSDDKLRTSFGGRAVEVRQKLSETSVMAIWDRLFEQLGLSASVDPIVDEIGRAPERRCVQ